MAKTAIPSVLLTASR